MHDGLARKPKNVIVIVAQISSNATAGVQTHAAGTAQPAKAAAGETAKVRTAVVSYERAEVELPSM